MENIIRYILYLKYKISTMSQLNYKISSGVELNDNKFYKNGETYEKKAQQLSKVGNSQAALYFSKAANQYSVNHKNMAKLCLRKSIDLLKISNDFYNVATQYQKIAELSLIDEESLDAIEAYENASKYYEQENLNPASFLCLSKAAYLLINLKKYDEAISHFERISDYYDSMLLTEHKSKNMNFEISLIKIYNETILHWEEFKGKTVNFEISSTKIYSKNYILTNNNRYHQSDLELLNDLSTAITNHNIYDIDKIIKNNNNLHQWQIELLKEIKSKIMRI